MMARAAKFASGQAGLRARGAIVTCIRRPRIFALSRRAVLRGRARSHSGLRKRCRERVRDKRLRSLLRPRCAGVPDSFVGEQ